MVLEGEEIELTVSKAVPSPGTASGHSAGIQTEYTEHNPPEWFTNYMAKARNLSLNNINNKNIFLWAVF
jgi:hypothetical protein